MGKPLSLPLGTDLTGSMVLVVGNLASWKKAGRKIPAMPGFLFVSFEDVTQQVLLTFNPDLVLSALVGDDYDVVDLARRLVSVGFVGRYRALTSTLPNPRLVLNEVRAAAPLIDFDLFDLERGLHK